MASTIQSLASALYEEVQPERADCVLIDLKPGTDKPQQGLAFQYWPDSVSDSKAVNYSPKEIPGGSLPVYQWTSSGERSISFNAEFTADVDPVWLRANSANPVDTLRDEGALRQNPDIRSALTWLRRFLLPSYDPAVIGNDSVRVAAPRKAVLKMKNSGIGLYGGAGSSGLGGLGADEDSIVCVMTQCEITFEAFFPSGAPRAATVALAFAQVPQHGGFIEFPGVTGALEDVVKGDRGTHYGYKLTKSGYTPGAADTDPPLTKG